MRRAIDRDGRGAPPAEGFAAGPVHDMFLFSVHHYRKGPA